MSGPLRWFALLAIVSSLALLGAPLSPPTSVAQAPDPPVTGEPAPPCPPPPDAAPAATAEVTVTPVDPFTESSALVTPEAGGTLASADGLVEVAIPAGAVAENAELTIEGRTASAARSGFAAYEFSLTAVRTSDGTLIADLAEPGTFTLRFRGPAPANAQQFALLWFNEAGAYWYEVPTSYDQAGNTFTASSKSLGVFELAADPSLVTAPDGGIVYPLEGGVVKSRDGQVELTFSPGDTVERLRVTVTPREGCQQHPAARHTIAEFALDAVALDRAGAPVSAFAGPVGLAIKHSLDQVGPLNPESLGLYQLDESTGSWIEVPAKIEPARGTFEAELAHFSIYSTQGDPKIVLPPDIQYFQTDMGSGASTASIPLDLPAGPGGFAPSLSLTYSSSAVDEMKGSKTMGSWVGVGWNLSVPMVVKDPIKSRYYLSMNGVFDLLVRENNGAGGWYRFHTKRESNLSIMGHQCGGSPPDTYYEFSVRTKDGTEYQFGNQAGQWNCNGTDAENFFPAYWAESGWHRYPYRMSVTQITDAQANRANFTYWEDIRSDCYPPITDPNNCQNEFQYDQAAYPAVIRWGANSAAGTGHVYEVVFNQGDFDNPTPGGIGGWDEEFGPYSWQTGKVRFDSPVDTEDGVCIPKVMETRSLTDVLVRKAYGGTIVREYVPEYDKSEGDDTKGPLTCGVSGNLKLWRWTEKGVGGGGTLRTMQFSYENRAVQWEDAAPTSPCGDVSTNPNYHAKPRPHLNSFKNGFGGEITFTYERQWKNLKDGCGWGRWVNDVRTMKPGGGQPDQVYNYDYPMPQNPIYLMLQGELEMDAQFVGFATVTQNLPYSDKLVCDFETGEYLAGETHECRWYDGTTETKKETSYYALDDSCTAACGNWEPGNPSFSYSKFVRRYIFDETGTGFGMRGTRFRYGAYGNVEEVCHYTGYAPGTTDPQNACLSGILYRRSQTAFAYNTAKYIVGSPYQTWIKTGSGTDVASSAYFYDGRSPELVNPNWPPDRPLVTGERVWSDAGWITTRKHSYNTYGNKTSDTDVRQAGVEYQTTYAYGCSNTLVASETNVSLNLTTSYSYTETVDQRGCLFGRPEKITDPNGVAYNIRYDAFGRPWKAWWPDDSEGSATTQYSYWWDSTSPNRTTIIRKAPSTNPSDSFLYEYLWHDGFGRLIQDNKEINCYTGSLKVSTVDTKYDSAGNKQSESIPYEYSTSSCASYLTPQTKPNTSYEYDVLGRVTKVTNPDQTYRLTSYSFDGSTTSVTEINERGYKKEIWNDTFGRLIQLREYTGTAPNYGLYSTTNYGYDVRDNLTSIRDTAGNQTTIVYDKAGWKKSQTAPDVGTWTYQYYNDGLLKTQTDNRGIQIDFTYDAAQRIRTKYDSAFTFYYSYEYDVTPDTYGWGQAGTGRSAMPDGYPIGHLTMVLDNWGAQLFSYDARGRVTDDRRRTSSGGDNFFDTKHEYDSADRETKLTYPDGEQVTTTFDQQGMLERMVGTAVYVDSTDYNAAGLPTRFAYGGGPTVNYRYRTDMATPSDYRIWKIYTTGMSPSNFDQTYTYDARGNVTSVTDTSWGGNTRTYDHLDRLVSHGGQGGAYAYVYNAIGNLTCKCDWNVYLNVQYGQTANCAASGPRGCPHAMTSALTGLGNNTWHYDANGNLLYEKVDGVPRNSFTWDAENHLSSATYVSTTYNYYRDYNGDLVRRNGGGANIAYIGGIFEKNLGNSTITKYYYADGKRIAMRVGGTLKYIIQDNLGSTVATTNGTVAESRAWYNPFGELYNYWGTIPTDKRFTGQQREYETEPPNQWNAIYDYGARMYDAKIGRMLQPDAFYDPYNPQSLNRYSYALNNPTTYTDPTGNYPVGSEGERVDKKPTCYSCGRPSGGGYAPDAPIVVAPIGIEQVAPLPNAYRIVLFGVAAWQTCKQLCDDVFSGLGTLFSDDGGLEKLKEDAFEGIINDPDTLRGLSPQEIIDAKPDSWVIEPGSGAGTIRLRPKGRSGIQILLEPGTPTPSGRTPNVHNGPYARVSDGRGNVDRIPLEGNPTLTTGASP